MAKMKIFELKNLINEEAKGTASIESKDIESYIEKSFGVKKTHSSNLEDNEVTMIKNHFIQSSNKSAQTPVNNTTQTAGQKPVGQSSVRPAATGETSQRPVGHPAAAHTAANGETGQRPAGLQGTAHPVAAGEADQRPAGQSGIRQGQPGTQGQRPMGGQQIQRPAGEGQQVQRPAGEGHSQQSGPRPSTPGQYSQQGGQYQQGQRPAGQGQGGPRPSTPGQYSQQGGQYQQGQRPAGQGQGGPRPSTPGQYSQQGGQYQQGQRPVGQGQGGPRPSTPVQGNQDQSQGSQGQSQGYQGQRPAGQGYQGNRPAGQGYQGNRPEGQGQGYQGNRPAGQGYQGNRPEGQGQGYQGNRPAGQGYQGSRPYGQQGSSDRPTNADGTQRQGYQGNSPRPAGQAGTYSSTQNRPRPYGSTPGGAPGQGQRPAGTGYQGQGQSNYSRPAGSGPRPGGGYAPRSGEGFSKDDDDNKPSYNRATPGGNKRPAGSAAGRPGDRKTFDQQILDQKVAAKNDNSNKRNRDRINKEKNYKDKAVIVNKDGDITDGVKNKVPRKGQFIQPKPIPVVKADEIKTISLPEVLTIKDLADKMKFPPSTLVKKLFLAGKMVSINQEITYEEAEEIALEYEIIALKEVKVNEVEELLKEEDDAPETQVKRPPVVCVMGHVDHGKTSLLDAIRETNVTSREAGGITQHIGAYVVEVNGEKITFLDTPGHEAFTSMRMRGAKSTDIAILVVAADDGVMPQTIEAISHAKAAGVQIIVAINKIDKPSANIERVKQELTEYELIAEDWGGDTIFAPVSAHTKEGIEHLLEMILLAAEMAELKANPNRNARGIVIEAELDKGRGPVATILVQKGTLRVGDNIVVGASYGKVRAMMDDKGKRVKEATPSTPVEILGLNEVPDAGETVIATDNDKEARNIADAYISQSKVKLLADTKAKLSLDGLFSQIQAGNIKELNLVVKADVQGSVEAMKQSLQKISNQEVAVRIVHGGVGAINESDVILASTSNAIIIGFNVKPDNAAKETADREKVDVKLYKVIYNAIDDIELAMKGLLDPVFEEKIIGHADIRQTFKASGIGTIAGSYVIDGKIIRGSKARIYRGTTLVYDGILSSLKRFQDDVREVAAGYECGLVFDKFNEVIENDKVELYVMVEVPR